MITIKECEKAGYPARTEVNIVNSDVTIAVAKDFGSTGEILTKKLCTKYKKLYIPVPLIATIDYNDISNKLNALGKSLNINIAGNGIYSLTITQDVLTNWMMVFLMNISLKLNHKILSIRSGGQTGVDEAGVIAADNMDIPAFVLAPKGYMYRDINHKDILNEKLFKNRFQKLQQ